MLVSQRTLTRSSGGNNSALASAEMRTKYLALVLNVVYFSAVGIVMLRVYKSSPWSVDKKQKKQVKDALLKRLKRNDITEMDFNQYECAVAQDIINPEDIEVTFAKIGGLDEKKTEIYNLAVAPLKRPDLFLRRNSRLLTAPKGILLYGAPGTGKTMLAKAIAKEAGATFINLRMATITSKWHGESTKLVAAVFGLAHKLRPSIIFIDEIDAFLRQRSGEDQAVTSYMIGEFMTQWDGMATDTGAAIMVLGATNRPYDVDPAILRRLPRSYEIGLPDEAARLQILQVILDGEEVDESVDLAAIARDTANYSGSDLKELCKAAAVLAIHEQLQGEGLTATSIAATTTSAASAGTTMRVTDGGSSSMAGDVTDELSPADSPSSSSAGSGDGDSDGELSPQQMQRRQQQRELELQRHQQQQQQLQQEEEVEVDPMIEPNGGEEMKEEDPDQSYGALEEIAEDTMGRVEDEQQQPQLSPCESAEVVIRPISAADFATAMLKVRPSGANAEEYLQREREGGVRQRGGAEARRQQEHMNQVNAMLFQSFLTSLMGQAAAAAGGVSPQQTRTQDNGQ